MITNANHVHVKTYFTLFKIDYCDDRTRSDDSNGQPTDMCRDERYRTRRTPRTRKHVCSLSIVACFGYDIRLRLINVFRCIRSA